jgi:hypothetical protein
MIKYSEILSVTCLEVQVFFVKFVASPLLKKTPNLWGFADCCWNGTFMALIPQNKAVWASCWKVHKIYFEKLWTLKLEMFRASDILNQSFA